MENKNTTTVNVDTKSAKRHTTSETVIVEVLGRKDTLMARMNNLSLTGAFIELTSSNYAPKAGDVVRINVVLRQVNKSYLILGEVIWARGLGLGINFLK